MKRTSIAVAVALLASPALALEVGPPFEQNELDRTLPNIQFAPVEPYVADARAPYEQLVIDRALPNFPSAPCSSPASRGRHAHGRRARRPGARTGARRVALGARALGARLELDRTAAVAGRGETR